MFYFSKSLKSVVLLWLLKQRRGDLIQLYAENTTVNALTYGLRCIVNNYGSAHLQEISEKDLNTVAQDIKSLYFSPSWDRLARFYEF